MLESMIGPSADPKDLFVDIRIRGILQDIPIVAPVAEPDRAQFIE
jgi:hypothetical protein